MTTGQQDKVKRIISAVCRVGDVDRATLVSKSKVQHIADMRSLAMYAASRHAALGVVESGATFNRDHSTVTHAVVRMGELLGTDQCPPSITEAYEAIKKELQLEASEQQRTGA